jgi:F-type H+-transporting ATPase subunit epsilon
MADTFELQVVTPDRQIVREDVEEVQAPARGGYLGILPGHAPLLSEMQQGELSYRQGNEWHYLSVFWGFVEVLPDRVVVLAETAERAEEIDLDRARKSQKRAEGRLGKTGETEIDFNRAQVALQRALIRLQVAGHAGKLSQ